MKYAQKARLLETYLMLLADEVWALRWQVMRSGGKSPGVTSRGGAPSSGGSTDCSPLRPSYSTRPTGILRL